MNLLKLTVATFNLYNLLESSPGSWSGSLLPVPPDALTTKLAKLRLAVQHELALPDLLVVQEVAGETRLQRLADEINQGAGTAYEAAAPPTSDRRGIGVGLLWQSDRLTVSRVAQMAGPGVAAAFGPRSPSPGREPLVGTFEVDGEELVVVALHFKSDYVPPDLAGFERPLRQAAAMQRAAQARVVRDYLNRELARNPEALLLVAGDFNEGPAPHPATRERLNPLHIVEGVAPEWPFTNLLPHFAGPSAYSFRSDDRSMLLDHILVSPALRTRATGANVHHFNVDYPQELEMDPATAVRASDHDPVTATFSWLCSGVATDP